MQGFGHRLGDEEAVERGVVEHGEAGDLYGMTVSHVEFTEAADWDLSICIDRIDADFAEAGFDGYLPNADGRDEDLAGT